MKNFVYSSLGGFLMFTLASTASAAELYGKFSSANRDIFQEAVLFVSCDDWRQSVNIGKDGKYNVRGIPGNRGCFFTVKHPKFGESPEVRFNTNKSVVTLNAELRVKDNRILVLRR